MALDYSTIGHFKDFGMYRKEAEEFEARKRQQQLAMQTQGLQNQVIQRDLTAPKPFFEGAGENMKGMDLLAQDIAMQNPNLSRMEIQKMAFDQFRGANPKQQMVTDASGRTYLQSVPQQPLFGGGMPEMMRTGTFTGQPMEGPAEQPTGNRPPMLPAGDADAPIDYGMGDNPDPFAGRGGDSLPVIPLQQSNDFNQLLNRLGGVSPNMASSPVQEAGAIQAAQDVIKQRELADMRIQEAQVVGDIEAARQMRVKQFEDDLAKANTEIKTGKAQVTIKNTLSKLEDLNNQLKIKQALVSNDQNMLQNLSANLGSTVFGQNVSKVANADVQTLRGNYERARDSLIPFYISYFELPATVVDTEEFQQRILASFGDPTLSYETNKFAIDNMRGQFGLNQNNNKTTITLEEFLSE